MPKREPVRVRVTPLPSRSQSGVSALCPGALGRADGSLEVGSWSVQAAEGPVTRLAASPDGTYYTSCLNGTIRRWRPGENRSLRTWRRQNKFMAPTADGRFLLVGCYSRLELSKLSTGAAARVLPTGYISSLDWDGLRILVATEGQLKLWDPYSEWVRDYPLPAGAVRLLLLGDQALLASGQTLELWDLKSGNPLWQVDCPCYNLARVGDQLLAVRAGELSSLRLQDGQLLARQPEAHSQAARIQDEVTWSEDGWLRIWDPVTLQPQAAWQAPVSAVLRTGPKQLLCGDSSGGLTLLEWS